MVTFLILFLITKIIYYPVLSSLVTGYRMIEYQTGKDLKDHLIHPFFAKVQSGQGGLAPAHLSLKSVQC